jgi:membrane protein
MTSQPEQARQDLSPSGLVNESTDSVYDRFQKWAFKIDRQENKIQGIVRSWVRILFIMNHEFSNTAISLRASALTYSIVLSMVPILAMSTAVLKGLGRDDQLKIAAYKLIEQFEPEPSKIEESAKLPQLQDDSDIQKQLLPGEDFSPDEKEVSKLSKPEKESLTSHLRKAVDTTFAYVDRTNFAALGAFGIVGLLIAVILVLSTIESAMNDIWHTRKGRSIFRKIMDYLALLILLPISINIALAGDAILESPRIMSYIHTFIPSPWAVKMLFKLLPFLFVVLSLTVMYLFFPNVRVKTHAALTGAIFAGFFWFVVQRIYIVLQIGVANYNAIYGSFATVPLFLIWIYIGWMFILLGAIMAYAVQNRHQFHPPGAHTTPQRELQLAFDVLNTVYTNFALKRSTSLDDLANIIVGDLPGDIQKIINRLVEGGLLYQTENNGSNYVPATSSENIEASNVVQLFLGNETIPTTGGQFSTRVVHAAEKAIPGDAFPLVEQPAKQTEEDPNEGDEKAL